MPLKEHLYRRKTRQLCSGVEGGERNLKQEAERCKHQVFQKAGWKILQKGHKAWNINRALALFGPTIASVTPPFFPTGLLPGAFICSLETSGPSRWMLLAWPRPGPQRAVILFKQYSGSASRPKSFTTKHILCWKSRRDLKKVLHNVDYL